MGNFLTNNWIVIKQAMDLFVLACALFGLGVLVPMIRNSFVRSR